MIPMVAKIFLKLIFSKLEITIPVKTAKLSENITAILPAELVANPGTSSVYTAFPGGVSNPNRKAKIAVNTKNLTYLFSRKKDRDNMKPKMAKTPL